MNLIYPLILGSNSPRRQEILKSAGFNFEVLSRPIDEDFPSTLTGTDIPVWIAEKKVKAYEDLTKSKIVICADTVVIKDQIVFGKPQDRKHAIDMLKNLSNGWHEVITGVSIKGPGFAASFSDTTQVHFNKLSEAEINYYIENFGPYDKAGAYGIQEWIGSIAIDKIKGSYQNVVGLPISLVYEVLKKFKA